MSVSPVRRAVVEPPPQDSPGSRTRPQRHAAASPPPAGTASLVAGYSSGVRGARSAPSEAQIQFRLDAFAERMVGTYQVGGQVGGVRLSVAPPFRMVGGMNQESAGTYVGRIKQALGAEFSKVARDVGYVTVGKGTPEQLKRVTQALIDSPAFAKYTGKDTEANVRQLMWDHGIGMDCSGYVHHALVASRADGAARLNIGDPLQSALQSPPASAFRRVAAENARAGDVMLLSANGDAGHKVIVYARHEAPPDTEVHARVASALGSASTARVHLIEVDSSWGASGDPARGGVKREVWAFDADSGRWASLHKNSRGQWAAIASTSSGPYDHKLQGIFRPKSEH